MAKTGNFGITLISSGAGAGATIITTAIQTPSAIDISGIAGSSLVTWKSMTFVVSQGTIDIDGITFSKGTYTYSNVGGLNILGYDATNSTNAKILIQI